MPYQWIDPDIFLEYVIYHCFDDDDRVAYYWYTTDPSDCNYKFPETKPAQFDIRNLPDLGLDVHDFENHAPIIRQAIEASLIPNAALLKPEPLIVKIAVRGSVAEIVQQPPGVEIEIINCDNLETEQTE